MASWLRMRQEAADYLLESRKYIYFAAALFAFFCVAGFFASDRLTFLNEVIEELISKVAQLEGLDIGLYIFANNLQSAFFSIVSGIVLGIFPLLNIVLNGTVIGYVIAIVSQESSILEIWKLLPHGIFELPAIFISFGLGLKLGTCFFGKKPIETLKIRLYRSMLVFIFFVLPLLLLAAIIEGALIDFYE